MVNQKSFLENPWFQMRLKLLFGCRVIEIYDAGGGRLNCNGKIWTIEEKDKIPEKADAALPGYGVCDCKQKLITVKKDAPPAIKYHVAIHELTHGIPEFEKDETEAIGRASFAAPIGAIRLMQERGKGKLGAFKSQAPKRFEETVEGAMDRFSSGVEQATSGAMDTIEDRLHRVFRQGKYKRKPWKEDLSGLDEGVDSLSDKVEDMASGVNRRIDKWMGR
jgi:hypothetical protein